MINILICISARSVLILILQHQFSVPSYDGYKSKHQSQLEKEDIFTKMCHPIPSQPQPQPSPVQPQWQQQQLCTSPMSLSIVNTSATHGSSASVWAVIPFWFNGWDDKYGSALLHFLLTVHRSLNLIHDCVTRILKPANATLQAQVVSHVCMYLRACVCKVFKNGRTATMKRLLNTALVQKLMEVLKGHYAVLDVRSPAFAKLPVSAFVRSFVCTFVWMVRWLLMLPQFLEDFVIDYTCF